jgi:hypothetical protein
MFWFDLKGSATTELQDSLIYADLNCDGIFNSGDAPIPYCPVLGDDGSLMGMSNSEGYYQITWPGGIDGSLTPEPLFGFDATTYYYFPVADSVITTDMGMCPQTFINNIHLDVAQNNPAVENEMFSYRICVTNYSTQTDDITLKWNPALGDSVSIIDLDGASPIGSYYIWNLTDLGPMETQCFDIVLQADDLSSGEQFQFTTSTYFTDSGIQDNAPSDNQIVTAETILSSFQSNSKTVNLTEIDYLDVEIFESIDLNYSISFGSISNDTITQVVVTDTISPLLDLSTFELVSVSHDYGFTIQDRVLTWTFPAVNFNPENLSYQNNGMIRYNISTIENPLVTDTIYNTATLQFDSLASQYTNSTITSFYLCPDSVQIMGEDHICASVGGLFIPQLQEYDTFLWVLDGTPISENDSLLPFAMTAGQHELAIVISNAACTVTGLLHVTAEEIPTLEFSDPDLAICNQVSISALSNASVDWFNGDVYLLSGDDFTTTTNGNFTASANNSCGVTEQSVTLFVPIGPTEVLIINDNGTLSLSEQAIIYSWSLDNTPIPDSNLPVWIAQESGNYSAELLFASGCSLLADQINVIIGIEEVNDAGLTLFPNPCYQSGIWIICDQQDVNSEFTLCRSNGQIIRKMTMSGNTMYMETTGLPPGQYFVSFLSEGRIISKELVLQ